MLARIYILVAEDEALSERFSSYPPIDPLLFLLLLAELVLSLYALEGLFFFFCPEYDPPLWS